MGGASQAKQLLLRILAAYSVLYTVGPIPPMVPWFAHDVLRIAEPVNLVSSGSGDTLFKWVEGLLCVILSMPFALIWSGLDRRGRYDAIAGQVFRVLIRYFLAATLMAYGSAKLSQFPPLLPDRLLQPFGDFSPMGVLWSFTQVSPAYSLFAGFGEMTGAVLLMFRRTTTLGALISVAVLANVVALNFAYDVPVKLFSSHLLLFGLLLLVPDTRRLLNCLVLNRPVESVPMERRWPRPWMGRAAAVLKLIAVSGILFGGASTMTAALRERAKPNGPLLGAWKVDSFALGSEPGPPRITDRSRWASASMNAQGILVVRRLDGGRQGFMTAVDEGAGTLKLMGGPPGTASSMLRYSRPAPDRLRLEGSLNGQAMVGVLHRAEPEMRLLNRGFHWITEAPYNR